MTTRNKLLSGLVFATVFFFALALHQKSPSAPGSRGTLADRREFARGIQQDLTEDGMTWQVTVAGNENTMLLFASTTLEQPTARSDFFEQLRTRFRFKLCLLGFTTVVLQGMGPQASSTFPLGCNT